MKRAEIRETLALNDNGKVIRSVKNVISILEQDPILEGAFRKNLLTDRVDVVNSTPWNENAHCIEDDDLHQVALIMEDYGILNAGQQVVSGIRIVASEYKFHPIQDKLNALEWDGVPRVAKALHHFLGCEESELVYESLKIFMLGAYSLIVLSPRKMIGARDPFGFKPLCIGKRDNTYVMSSETCALDAVGAEFVRDVLPGEIVTITADGRIESDTSMCQPVHKKCIFEYIYFARPDSHIDGVSVYMSRIMAGRLLAKSHPVDADLVVGVPESGNVAAMGYALESGIPYGMAFIKNSYVGRTFIKPKQAQRESSVKIKLNVLTEAVKDKRVIMIDDSIVRGTTSARIVKMLKDAGAKEVHVRISSPPFLYPCYFGTDIPSSDQLIASTHTVDQICEYIGADSLGYIDVNDLKHMVEERCDFCDACFTGNYPIAPPDKDIRGEHE